MLRPGMDEYVVTPRLGRCHKIDPRAPRPKYFEPNSAQWWRKGRRPERDSFREKCYEAERAFIKTVEQQRFPDVCAVAVYVRAFMEKKWFQRRFPHFIQCLVRYQPGLRGANATPVEQHRRISPTNTIEIKRGKINLGRWAMGAKGEGGGEISILHELAHAVLPWAHHHDRRWLRTFLEFIGSAMGYDKKRMFQAELKKRGLLYSPFKRLAFSPEQLARLAACRPPK